MTSDPEVGSSTKVSMSGERATSVPEKETDPAEVLELHMPQMTLPQRSACRALLNEFKQLRAAAPQPQKGDGAIAPAECPRCEAIYELFTEPPPKEVLSPEELAAVRETQRVLGNIVNMFTPQK